MTYHRPRRAFTTHTTEACPGDVFAWYRPDPIGKRKYHLCLSYDFDFVFLNTPKDRVFRSDYHISANDMRFLKPTETQFSSVSCANLQAVGNLSQLRSVNPVRLGNLASDILLAVLEHICALGTATPEEVERMGEVIETMRPALLVPGRSSVAGGHLRRAGLT